MNQLFDDAQAYNADYGHTLNLHIDSHCDLIGSDMEIASAFSNLITNAIKYTPKAEPLPLAGTMTVSMLTLAYKIPVSALTLNIYRV